MAVRWGLLSTANINRQILGAAAESEEVEILAVASRDRGRAEEYAREHGLERAYGTYDELLADPDVEAIYNPLPNSLHVPWAVKALEAGKHVLCEKPFSPRPDEVAAAFDLAEERGLVLSEAFMYRHAPQSHRVAELVRDGALGRLNQVRATFSFGLTDPANVRMQPGLDGGALLDVGCYCVSGARLVAGEPERVFAEQVVGETGVDMAFFGTMVFPGGVVAQFDASFQAPSRQRLEAVGDEGELVVEAPWRTDWEGDPFLKRGGRVERVDVERPNAYVLELENMGDAVRGRAEPLLGREDAVGQARVLAALLRSAEEGRPVEL